MAETQFAGGFNPGKERERMLEDVILIAFCFLVALGSLGVMVWLLATGQLLTIDGLLTTTICLLFLMVFGGNFAWSVHKGEVHALLQYFRKKS